MIRGILPYLLYSLIALISIFLQGEIFSDISIFGVKPDLLVILVALGALKSDEKSGFILGLLVGFWIDLINAGYFGMNMVVYAVVGLSFGLLGKKYPKRSIEGYFYLILAATLISGILTVLIFGLVMPEYPMVQSFIGTVLPLLFYNSLIDLLVILFIWIYRHLPGELVTINLTGYGIIWAPKGKSPEVCRKEIEAKVNKKRTSRRSNRSQWAGISDFINGFRKKFSGKKNHPSQKRPKSGNSSNKHGHNNSRRGGHIKNTRNNRKKKNNYRKSDTYDDDTIKVRDYR